MKTRIDSGEQSDENMNWDEAGNDWERFKGKVQARWRQLSDEQVSAVAGQRDKLLQTLQETYGLDEDAAEREVHAFETGGDTVAGAAAGRGVTERAREYGGGNETGGTRTQR